MGKRLLKTTDRKFSYDWGNDQGSGHLVYLRENSMQGDVYYICGSMRGSRPLEGYHTSSRSHVDVNSPVASFIRVHGAVPPALMGPE